MQKEPERRNRSHKSQGLFPAIFASSVRGRIYTLLLVILFVYGNTIRNKFAYDDNLFIVNNPSVHNPQSFFSYFTHSFPPNEPRLFLYRPLVAVSYLWDWCLGHKRQAHDNSGFVEHIRVLFFHLTNIFLHIGVVLVLFYLIRSLYQSDVTAFIGALVFAVHPVHVEAVTSIVGRAETLCALFYLLSLYLFVQEREKNGLYTPRRLASYVFAFAALLSKESGITLPVVIFATDWYVGIQKSHSDQVYSKREIFLRNAVARVLPYLAVSLLYLVIRLRVLGIPGIPRSEWYFGNETVPARLAAMCLGFLVYVKLLIIPHNMSIDYNFPLRIIGSIWASQPAGFQHPGVILGLLALLLYAGLIIRGALRKKKIVYPLLFFLITLFPFSNIIPFGDFIAERFLYLPSIAWCLLVGILYEKIRGKREYAKPAAIILILLVLCYSFRTLLRNDDWRSDMEIWNAERLMNPKNPNLYHGLGTAYATARTYHLNKGNAFRIRGDFKKTAYHLDLAREYEDLAIKTFKTGMKEYPRNYQTYLNYGALCVAMREPDIERAEEILLKGAGLLPENITSLHTFYHYIGIINLKKTPPQPERSLEFFHRAHRLKRSDNAILANLADLLVNMGRLDESLVLARQSLARNPCDRRMIRILKKIRLSRIRNHTKAPDSCSGLSEICSSASSMRDRRASRPIFCREEMGRASMPFDWNL